MRNKFPDGCLHVYIEGIPVKIVKKDGVFIAVIVALLGALYMSTGKVKAKNVPDDEKHNRFHDVMRKGGDRVETEKSCTACHGPQSTPLSKAHPPKEQCLLCHKLVL
jgi:hypothetical protein